VQESVLILYLHETEELCIQFFL